MTCPAVMTKAQPEQGAGIYKVHNVTVTMIIFESRVHQSMACLGVGSSSSSRCCELLTVLRLLTGTKFFFGNLQVSGGRAIAKSSRYTRLGAAPAR
jgi:hypothetical protein